MSNFQSKPFTFLLQLLNRGQERSVKIKKNILEGILIKGGSILVSLVMVPLTIDYINPTRYGIWLTISSVVGWFSFFDIGLTQGLRNKFAEAKTRGDDHAAQSYVSTAYAILGGIFFTIWALFMVVNQFLNWPQLLGLSADMGPEVSILAVIVFTYFCIQFVFKIISTILTADQQPSKASAIDLFGQLLSLVFVLVLTKTTGSSLVMLGIALCLSPLLVFMVANAYFFGGIYKKYRPLISKINLAYTKDLLSLGVVFFVIQIAFIIQFQTANFIISKNFGPTEVVSYHIVYKYFGMLEMVTIIFVAPFWSASTEAYLKGDFDWIKGSMKKYNLLNILLFGVSLVMLLLSNFVYDLWLGKGTIHIDFMLSFCGFLYFNFAIFGAKYVKFLNGISALRLQFFSSLVTPILYLVSSLIMIKVFHLGVYSVFISAIFASFNSFILAPIQYSQIIEKNKRGIWAK